MWKYYKYFCKVLKELKDFVELMDEKVYKCIKVDGFRWVFYLFWVLQVLFCKNYRIIVIYFEYVLQV